MISENGTFIGAALDTETTGLDSARHEIIEIAIQLFRFELPSGRVLEKLDSYTALQQPTAPVTLEIELVTGITNALLAGQSIDWSRVDSLLSGVDVVLAHNAAFDRGFVDRKSVVSREKLWACTSIQIDWRGKGFKNARLVDVCGAQGITYSAHRAMSDVGAMLQVIQLEDVFTGKPYLVELMESARREMAWIEAGGDTFAQKEQLKAQGFRWSGTSKTWGKLVPARDQEIQVELIQAAFPQLKFESRLVLPIERFKPNTF
jgi:DNA polymerase-3 subunit epsilon